MIQGYLNNRGYVINKNDISDSTKSKILNDLTVKPYIPKSIIKVNPYPIYRESVNKYYLPRFYGIDLFGNEYTIKISKGIDININFKGQLRDYQITIVNKISVNNIY